MITLLLELIKSLKHSQIHITNGFIGQFVIIQRILPSLKGIIFFGSQNSHSIAFASLPLP